MKDMTEGKLQEVLEYAKSKNDESLQKCLDRLVGVEKVQNVETYIFPDWAEKSFGFVRYITGAKIGDRDNFRGNGGIIFHGHPDSGYAVNGSVQMEPGYGWQIHT